MKPALFSSPMAPHLEAFVRFKRSLGQRCGMESLRALQRLDRFLKARSAAGLDGPFLLDFLATMAHCAPNTRRFVIVIVRRFCHYLVRIGRMPAEANPAGVLILPRRAVHLPRIYTLQELVRLLSFLRGDSGRLPFDRHLHFTVFHLIYACGLRVSEPLRLRVEDVDLQEGTLFIRDTKFGKSRHIPVGRRAAEYLAAYHAQRQERLGSPAADAPFFVTQDGRPLTRNHLERVFARARLQAGLVVPDRPAPRIHDLRHSMAVHRLYKWYMDGVPPQEKLGLLSIYMGHVLPASTQHYLHLSLDFLRVAGKGLERTFRQWLEEVSDVAGSDA